MLVLTRKVGEEIVIGDNIRVQIIAVQSQRVRVAITAPYKVAVHRAEVHQRLQDLNACPGGVAEQNDDGVGLELRIDSTAQSNQVET